MVGDLAGDHLDLLAVAARPVVAAGQLQGRLDRLRAAVGEEDLVQIARGERGDPGGELDRARVRVAPDGDEVELPHLSGHRVAELGAAVAGVDAEERREAVEVAVAMNVPDVAAVAAYDDRDLVLGAEDPIRAKCIHRWPLRPGPAGTRRSTWTVSGGLVVAIRLPPISLSSAYKTTPRRTPRNRNSVKRARFGIVQSVQPRSCFWGIRPLRRSVAPPSLALPRRPKRVPRLDGEETRWRALDRQRVPRDADLSRELGDALALD